MARNSPGELPVRARVRQLTDQAKELELLAAELRQEAKKLQAATKSKRRR